MLSSLSDTDAGKKRVGAPATVAVLVALLPVATPRVQRQVLLILRRVLMLVDPKAVDDKVAVPGGLLRAALEAKLTAESKATGSDGGDGDGDALAAATTKADAERKRSTGRGSTVAALLMCYAKALALQVRGRADGRPVMTNATLSDDLYPGHVGQVRPAAQAGPAVCGVWRVALDLRGGLGVWDVWRMPPIPLKPFFISLLACFVC